RGFAVSRATGRGATRSRLPRFDGTDKAAHELAIDLLGHRLDVKAGAYQKLLRILCRIDPGRLNADLFKPCLFQFREVHGLFQRSCDAASPEFHTVTDCLWHRATYDDVRDSQTATRPEHSKRLIQHAVFVRREIDDTIRDDEIDRIVGKRDLLDLAFQK